MAIAIDQLTELIIAAAISVHKELGPGLLESIYRDCMQIELTDGGLNVEVERRVPIFYRGKPVRDDLKVDLLVDGQIIVEISGCPAGLLFNFNSTSIRTGLRRLNHPKIHAQKRSSGDSKDPSTSLVSLSPDLLRDFGGDDDRKRSPPARDIDGEAGLAQELQLLVERDVEVFPRPGAHVLPCGGW